MLFDQILLRKQYPLKLARYLFIVDLLATEADLFKKLNANKFKLNINFQPSVHVVYEMP